MKRLPYIAIALIAVLLVAADEKQGAKPQRRAVEGIRKFGRRKPLHRIVDRIRARRTVRWTSPEVETSKKTPSVADQQFHVAAPNFKRRWHQHSVSSMKRFLKDHPNDPRVGLAHYFLGIGLSDKKKYQEAILHFTRAMELDSAKFELYGYRAFAHFNAKNTAKALADFKDAIKHSPEDAGKNYRPSNGKKLSQKSIDHGERQVLQMVMDRPRMGKHIKKGNPIWKWAARKFAGEDLNDTIDWDPTPPNDGWDAAHVYPTKQRRGLIRVSEKRSETGQARSSDDLWSWAVYELLNIANAKEFQKVDSMASKGQITEKEYVFRTFQIEYRTSQRCRAFYIQVYWPWAVEHEIDSDLRFWGMTLNWFPVEEAFMFRTDRNAYPWNPYSGHYVGYRTTELVKEKKFDEALKLNKDYLNRTSNRSERTEAQRRIRWIQSVGSNR